MLTALATLWMLVARRTARRRFGGEGKTMREEMCKLREGHDGPCVLPTARDAGSGLRRYAMLLGGLLFGIMLLWAALGHAACAPGKCSYKQGDGPPPYNTCVACRTSTPTTTPTTSTLTTLPGCAVRGKLCGPKGGPQTIPCCDPADRCYQQTQSGGNTGHQACLPIADDPSGPPTTTPTTSPATTVPSTPRPTVTTVPPTTLPPSSSGGVRRFTYADVGLAYYASSDDIMYDPKDGSWANQLVKQNRIEFAWFVVFPKIVALMAKKGVQIVSPNTFQDNAGKFIFSYGCRYLRCDTGGLTPGDQYVWRANYLVDRWHGLLVKVRGYVTPSDLTAHADWLPALMGIGVTATPRQTKPDKTKENVGEIAGNRRYQPLTAAQCAKLADALAAHNANDQAAIERTQLAFEATARDPYEAALFAHQFPFGVNPDKSAARRADLDAKKHAAYREWVATFGCVGATPTGTAPSAKKVVQARWKHVRVHLLRVLPEGYYLRELCGRYIDECPISGS